MLKFLNIKKLKNYLKIIKLRIKKFSTERSDVRYG